jgi:D-alanyl-lipoteichoic acid acyltransferase DltB (MBOAT superfamily)
VKRRRREWEIALGSFLDLGFWLVCAAVMLALPLIPGRRTLRFGLVNLAALGFLFGWQAAVVALGFAVVFNGVLLLSLHLLGRGDTHPSGVAAKRTSIALVGILFPAFLFVFHKLAMEHPAFVASTPRAQLIIQLFAALSFSYIALRCADMAHCVLWKRADLLDPLSTAGFLCPFHMILSGPVNRYDEHVKMNDGPAPALTAWVGLLVLNDITTGILYKYVIGETLRIFAFGIDEPMRAATWLDTAILFIYMFFDFAGYSRVCLGIGRLIGVPTPENFRAPFLASTITEFFTRWHMSLGAFIQRNIYTPLQLHLVRRWGLRRAIWGGLTALFFAWIFVGLWHRLSVHFLTYGLVMTLVVWLEKLVRDRLLKTKWARRPALTWLWRAAGPVYVFVVMTTVLHLLVITEILRV